MNDPALLHAPPRALPLRSALGLALLTALIYAAVGWLALMLAGPPGYASPLYPSAGFALAAALTWGRPAWVGVALGSMAVNVGLGLMRGQPGVAMLWLPATIASGAAAQAAVGAWLLRRFVSQPLLLIEARDVAFAGALGAASCAVSPSVATLALWAGGALPADAAASNWLTWCTGDALGVLIALPVALAFIGRPAPVWRPRRLSLGAPMLAALALLAAGMWAVKEQELSHVANTLERDADRLAASVQLRLQWPIHALKALHTTALARDALPDDETLRLAGQWWFKQGPSLQAMGFAQWVPASALASFEAAARADGLADFRVRHRDDGTALKADQAAVVLRHVTPLASNRASLGVNALSLPEARAAIESTRHLGTEVASAGFRLSHAEHGQTGIVVLQSLKFDIAGRTRGADASPDGFVGVVYVALELEKLLAGLADSAPHSTSWCLVDPDPKAARRRLAGAAAACSSHGAEPGASRRVMLANRPLELLLHAPAASAGRSLADTVFLVSGLACAAALGAWLLSVTGQNLRTRRAVDSATAELRREMAQRQLVEQEREISEARLRSILDNAPLGIAFLDPQGKLLQGNPHLFRMFGGEPARLLGRTVDSLTLEADLPQLQREYLQLLNGKTDIVRRPLRLKRDDGSLLTARILGTALREDSGRVRYLIAVLEDLTEHLQLEQTERARQRAEAASRAKSEFVSRMSHELRTPLNAMLGFAQLLGLDRAPALPEHQRAWVQQIQRAGWHLLELVNDTLDLARIESGAVKLQLQPVDLAQLVAGCADLVEATAASRHVSLALAVPPRLPPVLADATRLKQVVTNLLTNAVKYNREGGSVRVQATLRHPGEAPAPPRAAAAWLPASGPLPSHALGQPAEAAPAPQPQPWVVLEVIDSGLGMTPAQMAHLFEPYNRLGREASTVDGTGIGLVIARRLCEMMGGTLQARSQEKVGTTFSVNLTLADRPTAADRPTPEPPVARYRHRSVLYIEDNDTNIEVMRGILLQRPQIRLEVAKRGADGLAQARRDQPDLVLLDMQLPDMSGIDLLRRLRHDDESAAIPVVVLSADATAERIERALTLGAAHYLTKPVAVGPLLEVLDSMLEATESRFG